MTSLEENRRLAAEAYDLGDVTLKNAPEIMAIEGTNHCNIKCIMCPRGEPDIMRREVGHMEPATLARILEQSRYFTDTCWLHWFGEPLMSPTIWDNIRLAKTKIPNVGISTNATLLKPSAQQKILESGLDTLMIAVDGATKDVYEAVRKSARFSFEMVKTNVEEFLELKKATNSKKPYVYLSIIAMDITSSDLDQFKEYWAARGADEILFKPFVTWAGQSSTVFDVLAPVDDDRQELSQPRLHPCKALWDSVVVAWNGDVVPCCFDFDTKSIMGNIHEQSIDEIWNGPAYVSLRQAELEGRNHSPLCINCTDAVGRERPSPSR